MHPVPEEYAALSAAVERSEQDRVPVSERCLRLFSSCRIFANLLTNATHCPFAIFCLPVPPYACGAHATVVADVHALLPHASAAGRTLCNLYNYDFLLCAQALTALLAGRERRAAASLALHLLTVQTKLWTACQECDLCPLGATCAGYLQPPYDLSLLAVALSWNVSRRGTADDAWSSQLGPRRLLGRWLGANEPVLPVRPRPEIRLTVFGGHVECIHINADHRCMQSGEAAPHMCSASVPDHFICGKSAAVHREALQTMRRRVLPVLRLMRKLRI